MARKKDMFRYLLKYVGKYRVLTELTLDTHDFIRDAENNIDTNYDELYIPCSYDGKIKHTYSDSVLSYFTTKKSTYKKVIGKLDEKHISYDVDETDVDYIIFFSDTDLSAVARIVGAKTQGKKIHPFSEKNLEKVV